MKNTVATVVVSLGALLFAPMPAHATEISTSLPSGMVVHHAKESSAPQFVRGFSAHCRDRMQERRVSEMDVKNTVLLYDATAKYQEFNDTWLYKNGGTNLHVVLNDAGICVTVY